MKNIWGFKELQMRGVVAKYKIMTVVLCWYMSQNKAKVESINNKLIHKYSEMCLTVGQTLEAKGLKCLIQGHNSCVHFQ